MPDPTRPVVTDIAPFAMVPFWLLAGLRDRKPGGVGSALSVFIALAKWADRDDATCYPSQAAIADLTGLSVSTVQSALTLLRDVGAVTWEPTYTAHGDRGVNVYRLHINAPASDDARVTPPEPSGDPTQPTGGPHPAHRVAGTRAIDPEPMNQRENGSPEHPAAGPLGPPGFVAFYEQYPRKVGRPAALKAWRRLSAADQDAALIGLHRWVVYWRRKNEPEFIPHPSTWLNQQRWNDEPPRASTPGNANPYLDMVRGDR